VMQEPTRRESREGRRRGGYAASGRHERSSPIGPAGVWAAARPAQGDRTQHGKPLTGEACDLQPATREGQAGPFRVSERPIVPRKPRNGGGGKGPRLKAGVPGNPGSESKPRRHGDTEKIREPENTVSLTHFFCVFPCLRGSKPISDRTYACPDKRARR
jgi:hypothetical protein